MSGLDNQIVFIQYYDDNIEVNSFSVTSFDLTIQYIEQFLEVGASSLDAPTTQTPKRALVPDISNPEGAGPPTWVTPYQLKPSLTSMAPEYL